MRRGRRGPRRGGAPLIDTLSLREARRIALAAQGFARARPASVTPAALSRTIDRLALHQIDSVNVVARAHYLPAFSRLGPYDTTLIDRAAWGPRRSRRLFEYWAHEASLLPLDLHPLLRWRMARADRGEAGYTSMRTFAGERRGEAMALLARLRDEGPLAASDLEQGRTGWWEWSDAKRALEWLFYAGHVTTATRRRSFERVYDLPERVLPPSTLALSTPDPATAQRELVARAARAMGVATADDLRDYFRLDAADTKTAIDALVDEGLLIPVVIPNWPAAWRHRDAASARAVRAAALLAPFDPLIWRRDRAVRLFGFHYRIEIYTPAAKRQYGYYVLPFLHGDRLAARVDVKADRQRGILIVHAVHLEENAPPDTRDALDAELALMAAWLKLQRVQTG